MSEPVLLAKAARERLAAALNALQTDDDVPTELLEAAEPIAQAMSVLHRIERTQGANLEGRDGALTAVRTALDRLQKIAGTHDAVDIVMEAVASSLSKVHALARYKPPAAPVAPAPEPIAPVVAVTQPVAAQPAPAYQPAPQPAAVMMTQPVMAAQPAPSPVYQPAPQPAYQPAPQPAYQPAPQPAYQPAPQPAYQPAPQPQAQKAPPTQPAAHAPAPQPQKAPPTQPAAYAPQAQKAPAAKAPPGSIDVELGIHSASNFYKGLGGNDVIEHGGIFVATYKVQKIGTPVTLRVLLPGDYEFLASGVVQWIREGTSDPGFGARLTQISQEGRQLVYRYTRNREPMFYDDL
jgi:Tfp pilus assembly protein PilZ